MSTHQQSRFASLRVPAGENRANFEVRASVDYARKALWFACNQISKGLYSVTKTAHKRLEDLGEQSAVKTLFSQAEPYLVSAYYDVQSEDVTCIVVRVGDFDFVLRNGLRNRIVVVTASRA